MPVETATAEEIIEKLEQIEKETDREAVAKILEDLEQHEMFTVPALFPKELEIHNMVREKVEDVLGTPFIDPEVSECLETLLKKLDEIMEEQEKAVDAEKAFSEAIEAYLQDKPDEQELYAKTLKLLEEDSKDKPELAELQNKIQKLTEITQGTFDKETKTIPEKNIEHFFKALSRMLEKSKIKGVPSKPSKPSPLKDFLKQEKEKKEREEKEKKEREEKEEEETEEREEEGPEKAKGLNENVKKLLETRLKDKDLISHLDPVCSVINSLILKNNLNTKKLDDFLKNPEDFVDIDEEAVEKALEKRKIKDHEALLKQLKQELKQVQRGIELISKRTGRLSDKELESFKKDQENEVGLEYLIEQTEALIAKNANNFLYSSPRHILSMVYFYINKDKGSVDPSAMHKEMDDLVTQKRKELYKGFSSWVNRMGSWLFLKPTLEGTLRALAKDSDLARELGENADDRLAELSKLFKGQLSDVKNWVKNLSGGVEKHANTTVPRLVAYLELAIRDGKSSTLFRTGRAEKLVEHLKTIQREYVEAEIEKSDYKNDQERMLAYLKKINESHRYTKDITNKILKRHAAKTIGVKVGAAGALIAAPFSIFAALPVAAVAGGAYIAYKWKKVPEKYQPLAKKISRRTIFATGAYTAGALVGGTLLGLPLAAIALAPESTRWLWKKKGKAGKGLGTVGKGTLGAAKWLGKYTVGLPWFGPQYLLGKKYKEK